MSRNDGLSSREPSALSESPSVSRGGSDVDIFASKRAPVAARKPRSMRAPARQTNPGARFPPSSSANNSRAGSRQSSVPPTPPSEPRSPSFSLSRSQSHTRERKQDAQFAVSSNSDDHATQADIVTDRKAQAEERERIKQARAENSEALQPLDGGQSARDAAEGQGDGKYANEDGEEDEQLEEEEEQPKKKGFLSGAFSKFFGKHKAKDLEDGEEVGDEEEDEEGELEEEVDELKAKRATAEEHHRSMQQKTSVTYFTDDPIGNLKLRVIVRPAAPDAEEEMKPTTSKGEILRNKSRQDPNIQSRDPSRDVNSAAAAAGDGVDAKESDDGDVFTRRASEDVRAEQKSKWRMTNGGGTEQNVVFTWQEKKFNVREVLGYVRDKQRPQDALADRYSNTIKEDVLGFNANDILVDENLNFSQSAVEWVEKVEGFHIGTYVQDDRYQDPKLLSTFPTNSARTQHNPLAEKRLTGDISERKLIAREGSDHSANSMFIVATVDIPKGKSLRGINRFDKAMNFAEEVVLAEIRYDSGGKLEISPSLNRPLVSRGANAQQQLQQQGPLTVEEKRKERDHQRNIFGGDRNVLKENQDGKLSKFTENSNTFNRKDGWHKFVAPISKNIYWYRIENASAPVPAEEDVDKLQAVEHKRLWHLDQAARREQMASFEKSPMPTQMRLNCFGEIKRAVGFEDDVGSSLYVEYELFFDNTWDFSLRDRYQRRFAISHQAQCYASPCREGEGEGEPGRGYEGRNPQTDYAANFSFPFEFELTHNRHSINGEMFGDYRTHRDRRDDPDKKKQKSEDEIRAEAIRARAEIRRRVDLGLETDQSLMERMPDDADTREHNRPARSPMMYFQVNSVDSWKRHRVVGYGYAHVPMTPGAHDLQVSTWVPVGSVRQQMDRVFVGGCPSLKDLKLSGGPLNAVDLGMGLGMGGPGDQNRANKGWFLNKHGWVSDNSGNLELRINVVVSEHAEEKIEADDAWEVLAKKAVRSVKFDPQDLGSTDQDSKLRRRINKLKHFARGGTDKLLR